jgi:serine/threonine-protein kinase
MEASAAARARLPQLAKYEVLEEIGHGGMATVYRALDKRLGREVAVKVIHPHLRDSTEVVSRFNTEARAVAKLRHPNIVEVFDVSEAGDEEQYLVAELLRGTTLRKLLQAHDAMPPEIAASFALELLAALAHAHGAGVVHRDIKPENVLIEHRPAPASSEGSTPPPTGGERVVVKLTDFGIAKLLDAQGVTSTGQVLGSPAHMAPEQIEGGEVDARADVFGMGVLLYECMVGHLPFEGNNPAQVLRRVLDGHYAEAQAERPVVGAAWSGILDRALAHAPADRWADAGSMHEAIMAELARLGIERPKRELGEWLDDPAGYVKSHSARMIEKLCALAGDARKRGEVLHAAADYNRALAHAPDDPQLLRIVAGLNRAEARARLLRRGASALLLMVGLGAVAFGVGRWVHARATSEAHPLPTVTASVAPPLPSLTASVAPTSSVPVAASTVARPSPPVMVPKVVDRTVSLDLTPPNGVRVTIDGGETRRVQSGDALRLDSKAHVLSFTCDVCDVKDRSVAAGDKDEALVVTLSITPATLVILGPSDKTYQIAEHPNLRVGVGRNDVSITGKFESITVKQIDSGATQSVRLEAGKSVQATF